MLYPKGDADLHRRAGSSVRACLTRIDCAPGWLQNKPPLSESLAGGARWMESTCKNATLSERLEF